MKFTSIAALLAATAGTTFAAPPPEFLEHAKAAMAKVLNMMAKDCTWTIEDFQRECYKEDTKCWISFAINANDGSEPTKCSYESNGSHAPYANVACGDYTIGSTWSGQFGPGEGFTTLSVVKDGLIVYPAYKDTQLKDWVPVKPDQSYTPAKLP